MVQPPVSTSETFLLLQKETPCPVSSCCSHASRQPRTASLLKLILHGGCAVCLPTRMCVLRSGHQNGRLTCSHKENAGTEDDVVLAAVEPPGADAEPAEQEQDGAEDGEDAGGTHDAWAGQETEQTGQ